MSHSLPVSVRHLWLELSLILKTNDTWWYVSTGITALFFFIALEGFRRTYRNDICTVIMIIEVYACFLFRTSNSSQTLSSCHTMEPCSSDEFFQALNHAEQTFKKMENYLRHKQLCDVILVAGDRRIPAHR